MLKSVELPGGVKIELADVKAATDKVVSGVGKVTAKSDTKGTPEEASATQTEETLEYLREIAERDPALALVAFRIELEKRLRVHAPAARHVSLSQLARDLTKSGLLNSSAVLGSQS
jgi:hypothetical protein